MKAKKKYGVTVFKVLESEFDEDVRQKIGYYETFAVSESQAENNIRYRLYGNKAGQSMPVSSGCHWELWIEYEVKEIRE